MIICNCKQNMDKYPGRCRKSYKGAWEAIRI
nr:MAG TPA: hypothetical protein [Caudoviricetes sp.]